MPKLVPEGPIQVFRPLDSASAEGKAGSLDTTADSIRGVAAKAEVGWGVSRDITIPSGELSLNSAPATKTVVASGRAAVSGSGVLTLTYPPEIDEALAALDSLESSLREVRSLVVRLGAQSNYGQPGHNSGVPVNTSDLDSSFVVFAALRSELLTNEPKSEVLALVLQALRETWEYLTKFLAWLKDTPFGVNAQKRAADLIALALVAKALDELGLLDSLIKIIQGIESLPK